jgi:AAA15 family ATPase/GTPase
MFNISSVIFTNGPQNSSLPLTIRLKKITIFVGPNNSGKTTVLRDIEKWFNIYRDNKSMKILRNLYVSFSKYPDDYNEFEKDILEFRDGDEKMDGETISLPLVKKHPFEDIHDSPGWYNFDDIKNQFNNNNINYFREHFLRYFIIILDGKTRFELIKPQPYSIFRTNRTSFNYMTRLYLNKNDQKKLGNVIFKEFDWHPYLIKKMEMLILISY